MNDFVNSSMDFALAVEDRPMPAPGTVRLYAGDNMSILPHLPSGGYRLIYVDPPFNTGVRRTHLQTKVERDLQGDRVGFGGHRYRTLVESERAYEDAFDDYLAFLVPRLRELCRLLSADGSLFVHLDAREVHYVKVELDRMLGRASFVNELIWAYDYGARSRRRWSAKHDNILWYVKNPQRYVFRYEAIDRIPYLAPSLVGAEKAARGKTPTDVWWNTIVSPTGHEKTGYPTQKPLSVMRRLVEVHSEPGDQLLDAFAGSGSFGEAGAAAERAVTLIDSNPEACEVMQRRLASYLEPKKNPPMASQSPCSWPED